jgi:hypothetical protein
MQQSLLGKDIESIDRKKITEENFEEVYFYWKEQLFQYVTTKTKLSKLFLTDIQGNTFMNTETGEVAFNF